MILLLPLFLASGKSLFDVVRQISLPINFAKRGRIINEVKLDQDFDSCMQDFTRYRNNIENNVHWCVWFVSSSHFYPIYCLSLRAGGQHGQNPSFRCPNSHHFLILILKCSFLFLRKVRKSTVALQLECSDEEFLEKKRRNLDVVWRWLRKGEKDLTHRGSDRSINTRSSYLTKKREKWPSKEEWKSKRVDVIEPWTWV